LITLPDADSVGGAAAVSALRTGKRRPVVAESVYSGFLAPKAMPDISNMLRQGRPPPPPSPLEEMAEAEPVATVETLEVEPKPPPKPRLTLEFKKVDGQTRSVDIKVGDKVKTLTINRDEDGNMVSATL